VGFKNKNAKGIERDYLNVMQKEEAIAEMVMCRLLGEVS
jgi:hypothetical protein